MTGKAEGEKPIILVVDDEPFIRFAASNYITDAGWRPMEAESAEKAEAIVKAHPETKVLFTDINMPGPINGLQLAERIHRDHPDMGLVVTSGRHRLDDEDLPDDGTFLPKPYLEADLVRVLRAKLE